MEILSKIRKRINDEKEPYTFTWDELKEMVDDIKTRYGLIEGRDDDIIILGVLARIYLILATDTAKYFKYTQEKESVDRTMTPKVYLELHDRCKKEFMEAVANKPAIFGFKKGGNIK